MVLMPGCACCSSTCESCVEISKSVYGLPPSSPNSPTEVAVCTVTISSEYSLPVTVRISGGVDDDVKFNGSVIEPGQYAFLGGALNGAHAIGTANGGPGYVDKQVSARTFTLTLVDNFGFAAGMGIRVCVDPENTQEVCIAPTSDCQSPPQQTACGCDLELYGLQLTLSYFTATIGEYVFFENDATYRMSSALQNNGWSVVLWEKDSEWRFRKMRRVDLYCNSSSGSPKWYAYIRTRCIEYDNEGRAIQDSTDSWIGTFDCYESCEFSADDSGGMPRSRDAGDPIPLGDVRNVEFIERETGFAECAPPSLPLVRIGQVETC